MTQALQAPVPLQAAAAPRLLRAPVHMAIVGATGAVGAEMIACLEKRGFPVASLRLLASERSVGRSLSFRGGTVPVEAVSEAALNGADLVLFAADSAVSRQFAPHAVRAGAVVIDNSSAFRMDAEVPLVIPEVNGATAFAHRGIIANPNCCAAVAAMALGPLHASSPIRRIVAATYQAASGAGAKAMDELWDSTAAYLHGRPYTPRVLPHPYAFNLFSHDSAIDPDSGSNEEELKVAQELRKLLAAPQLRVGVTCVRVPVLRAHAIALTVEFERPTSPEEAFRVLADAPGVRLIDEPHRNRFPMPVEATGREEVLVGRIRRDPSDPSGCSLALFVVGDQLLKGAALNAVQIAESLLTGPAAAR